MKIIVGILAALGIANIGYAQENIFEKTTWKIENTTNDGSIVLRRAKPLNLPTEQAKFHFIQFDDDFKYATGTSCFGMNGYYSFPEDNEVAFSEGAAGMASDCEEPKSMVGTFTYEKLADKIILRPVAQTSGDNNEESDTREAAGNTKIAVPATSGKLDEANTSKE